LLALRFLGQSSRHQKPAQQPWNITMSATRTNMTSNKKLFLAYLMLISGLGGLLTGVDFGIIAGALLYLDKTVNVTEGELSFIVAMYSIGGFAASLVAGMCADWIGRKKMMVAGGLMFVVSIALIYTSQGVLSLVVARLLMGLAGGVLCVVVPLYMAESLPAAIRGRGTAVFQFLMTVGLLAALLIGFVFAKWHDAAVKQAAGDMAKIFAADSAAWRNMFLTAMGPGLLYTLGALFLKESPRWLFRRNRAVEAESILRRSRSEEEAKLEISEMGQAAARQATSSDFGDFVSSLLQYKYVVPFIIACIVLACNQATGINSIIAFSAVIFQGSGMSDVQASQSGVILMSINCAMTLVGAALVDRLGRKMLLSVGTAGIIVSLTICGLVYRQFEARRVDVADRIARYLSADGRELSVKVDSATLGPAAGDRPAQLNVLYRYEDGRGYKRQAVASAFSNAKDEAGRTLTIKPMVDEKFKKLPDGTMTIERTEKDKGNLTILRAKYGPIPSPTTGWLVTIFLCLFIVFYSVGPGVCVWLALTELMPTRIRATGMGIAMVLNTGVQILLQLFFLPVVGNHGFHVMFFIWAGCTVVYFVTATFFMPETKGKTLEEIEQYFERKARR
jgi:SP family myo-inositol transporter-like MFS transporter 13